MDTPFLRRLIQSDVGDEEKSQTKENTVDLHNGQGHPFFNPETHGFRRVALCIPRVHVANPSKNVTEHIRWLEAALARGVRYAIFPELSLTGYTCGDLFHSHQLQREALVALRQLRAWSADHPSILFSVGLPLLIDGMLFNVAVMIQAGSILGIAPKSYPPNYREFYEMRHFASASEAMRSTVSFPYQHDIPFGTDLLFKSKIESAFVIHMEICEDGWVPISPGTKAALAGATVLANHSASNVTVGKADYRQQLVVSSSGRNQCVQLYCAAGYGESSSALAWDGDGYIAERGELIAQAKRFELDGTITIADVDLHLLILERMRQTSFRQNAADNPMSFRSIEFTEVNHTANADLELQRKIAPLPFVPNDPARMDERCYETFNIQATSLARRLERLPKEKRLVFFGYSGGRDSTLVLLVALRAMNLLELPRTNIHCYSLPGLGTSDATRAIARALPQALGTSFKEISIVELTKTMFGHMELDATRWDTDKATQLRLENTQALTRKHVVFCEANQLGIVLGTGDLSEAAVGWCTYGADQFSYYNVNGGVPKTLVSHLIAWAAERLFTSAVDAEARQQLLNSLALDISPELLPSNEHTGGIDQKTEDAIGPFELIDFNTYHFARFGRRPATIAWLAYHAFQTRINPLTNVPYTIGDIKRWLASFLTRFFAAQAKRASMPESPKVGLACLDPRGDWRMPSDVTPDAWLRDLDAIPDTLS